MGSSLSGQLSMGSSLSELISSCKARIRTHVGAQKGKDSISIVDKITDAQLHEFHEAFSFFDKVCSRVYRLLPSASQWGGWRLERVFSSALAASRSHGACALIHRMEARQNRCRRAEGPDGVGGAEPD